MKTNAKTNAAKRTSAPKPRQDWFSRFSHVVARLAGRPAAFIVAVSVVVIWAFAGPFFGFDDTWQNAINTITTIITFLMVFVIQSTQNRDTLAIQVKLAEIILHMRGAPKQLADAEEMSERQLEHVHEQYRARARQKMRAAGRRRRG